MRLDRNELLGMASMLAMIFGGRKKVKVILDYVADAVEAYDTVKEVRAKIASAANTRLDVATDPMGNVVVGVPLTLSGDDVVTLDHALTILDRAAKQIKALTSKD